MRLKNILLLCAFVAVVNQAGAPPPPSLERAKPSEEQIEQTRVALSENYGCVYRVDQKTDEWVQYICSDKKGPEVIKYYSNVDTTTYQDLYCYFMANVIHGEYVNRDMYYMLEDLVDGKIARLKITQNENNVVRYTLFDVPSPAIKFVYPVKWVVEAKAKKSSTVQYEVFNGDHQIYPEQESL